MCMGALTALIENGIRVPDDIALVSFDDIEFGNLLRPRFQLLILLLRHWIRSYAIGTPGIRQKTIQIIIA